MPRQELYLGCDDPDRPSLYDPYADVTRERIQFDSLVLIESSKKPARPELPLFYGHGPAFIRTVIHLAYRASHLGFSTAAAGIFNAQRHGLSLTAWYVEALEDEPTRLADTPIRHILASEPPAPFDLLWAEDIHRYSIRFSPILESKP